MNKEVKEYKENKKKINKIIIAFFITAILDMIASYFLFELIPEIIWYISIMILGIWVVYIILLEFSRVHREDELIERGLLDE